VSVLKTKVVTNPDDRVGVVLVGVREQQNPNNFDGILVLQGLDRPSAQRIKQLQLEEARPAAQFEERYGYNRKVPLSDVFWTCVSIFNTTLPKNQFQSRVFLWTGCDAPCGSLDEQTAAETRARDLLESGADVELFPLPPPGVAFSMERFWSRVVPVDEDDYLDKAECRIEELQRRIRMRQHRKRTLQRISLQLCPDVEIGVSIYVTTLEARVPYPVYLLNENNKLLKSETRLICEQTGAILHPTDDVETFTELAGQRVYMSRAEVSEAKQFCEPGLRLLGVKPASRLLPHHRIFHSYFVYPNDRAVTGSAALCAALIDRLLEGKLMAIAAYAARKNSESVLVALLPQAESETSPGGGQLRPPGFHMIRLPWGEEVRALDFPAPEGVQVPPELTEAAQKAVAAMRLEHFAPGCCENPALQKHYAAVQALALQEECPEETVDVLQPDKGTLDDKAPLLQAWKAAIDAVPGGGGKRPLPAGAGGAASAPKAPRREAPAAPDTVEAMRELVHSGDVERLTVPVLRDWLKAQGVACTGKKGELVTRVRACV